MKYLLIIEFDSGWPPHSEMFRDKSEMIHRAAQYEREADVHCKMFELRRL